jgi:hypothetical protein
MKIEEVVMESQQNRRRFLGRCAKFGGACCALLAWNRYLPAGAGSQEKTDQGKKPIDLNELAYCGIPCVQMCELYKATLENDVQMKKLVYEKWGWKKKFGIEFDPDKVFCYTCKPGDKPKKVGMDACDVRNCAIANDMESCVQCMNLAACNKELWKSWPETLEFAKRVQARYRTQPGAVIKEIKTKP